MTPRSRPTRRRPRTAISQLDGDAPQCGIVRAVGGARLVVPVDAIVDVGQAGAAQQRGDLLGAAARERRLLRQRGAIREEHVAAVARDARAGALCGLRAASRIAVSSPAWRNTMRPSKS